MNKENQNIEWKESWRDEYLRWIAAFANTKGGKLFIGINDKGVVIGILNASKLLEEIPNKVRDILGIIVEINLLVDDEREYLEIVVEEYPYPVSHKGEYHIRSGSTKQELKGAALDKFLLQKQGKKWDGVPVPNITAKDLSNTAFDYFRKRAISSNRMSDEISNENNDLLLEKLYLLDGTYLKRAAILLFHNDPEKYITGAFIKIGFFRTDYELIYQDEVHGNLFEQIEKTMSILLTKYLKAYISYDKLHRIERFLFPESAIREALLNAIAHKDYGSANPIQISVYEDKIIFFNEGTLPEDWTVEQLKHKHASHPHNPAIASTLFRAGYIESWGRGTVQIINDCINYGIEPPIFSFDSGIRVDFVANQPVNPRETTQKATQKTTQKVREKIIESIKINPKISRKELAETIGEISEDGIKYHLDKLKNDKIIERIGADKGGYWQIN